MGETRAQLAKSRYLAIHTVVASTPNRHAFRRSKHRVRQRIRLTHALETCSSDKCAWVNTSRCREL
jgi:hypothetical protein